MPTVKKVKKKSVKRKRGGSVIDRIAPVSQDNRGMSQIVYGKSGTGKTTYACTAPKPLMLIGAEDGTQSVHNIGGVDFVHLDNSDEFSEIVEYLDGGKYKTGVLDTLGTLYDHELRSILGLEELPATKSWGMAQRGDWQQANTKTIERLRRFLALRDQGIHVIILAQERVYQGGEDNADGLLMPFVAASCTPGVVGWLNPACDYICQTFIRGKTEQKSVKIRGKTTTTTKKIRGVDYCLRTGPDEIYTIKFRIPKDMVELPEVIVDPSFAKIKKLIERGE